VGGISGSEGRGVKEKRKGGKRGGGKYKKTSGRTSPAMD